MTLTDWVGALGVSILLVAYLLNLAERVSQDSLLYIWLNMVGAALGCLASILLRYWPFIILEAVWTIVSFIALLRRG